MIEYYRETFRRVSQHPGGWLVEDNLRAHIAFALGVNEGAGGNALIGFREFLLTKIEADTAWWWPALALWLTEPVGRKGRGTGQLPADLDRNAVKRWYELLDQYLEQRSEPDGLEQIFRAYYSSISNS